MPSSSLDQAAERPATRVKARVKPRLRGLSHRYAFVVALVPCLLLVSGAPDEQARLASAVYAGSLLGLLGTSALYHGINWSPRVRYWVARIDLVMIFVLIAGTYTPIAMLRLEPGLASVVLSAVWGAALCGGILKTVWVAPPKWASAAVYVGVGSVALLFLPQVVAAIGVRATALMLLGGGFYVAGAIVYGLQWPDPLPEVFGYHETFHAFVIAGATSHFVAIALYVVPVGPRVVLQH
jgi:hemolysin III